MFQFVTYFLGALVALNLHESMVDCQDNRRSVCLLDDPPRQCGQFCLTKLHPIIDMVPGIERKLDRIEEQNTEAQESKKDLESRLQDLHTQLDTQLQAVQTSLQTLLNRTAQKALSKIPPPKFELIGSRFFYIETNNIKTWNEAAAACRQIGGYLASIQNESELEAIAAKLNPDSYYWLGIHDRGKSGDFQSLASGKTAKFLKWHTGYPKNLEQKLNCVWLSNGEMHDFFCNSKSYFICQADKEI
ncbi:accessory gland protein Acp29AB-like [Drosophila rhopaloa]|uniref:Accessory gland protein Acp29AB-like n=1 Tax=Drosophila rhopaloa TaxID=1041015 RepID=A0A6P4F1B5_DRORH|nr:accessory gland protein Acp29AB-like [Drosophila rhopaloa]